MAVIQISKIQVRRGQKNSLSGVPQLSSAEFAWAVDSQELFIGNGSVAEGAPYVGNTKIITEHDNLLELASSYQFAPDYLTGSVPRSLQSKLDEIQVSVIDFGAINTGVQDNVSAFETACTDLFRNTDSTYKKVLVVPNGTYKFTSDLKIPANAIIRGETANGVILDIGQYNIQFVTSNGDEIVNFNSTNRPTNIHISNLTISRTTGQVVLSGVADSKFVDVTFEGDYTLLDSISDIDTESAAVFWDNNDYGTRTTGINFVDCDFNSNSISVKSLQSIAIDTSIVFDNCTFFVNYFGTYIAGVAEQGNKWNYNDCKFVEIYYHAFKSTNGRYTVFDKCLFDRVGNGNSPTEAAYPMVYFNEKIGNILLNCSSDRQQTYGITTNPNKLAYTEVYNSDKTSLINRNYTSIDYSVSSTTFAVLSALNLSYTVRYFLQLGVHSRTGKLTISISNDQTDVAITDEYQYSPSLTTDTGGPTMTNFQFLASLNTATAGAETLVLSYKNPTSGATGTLSFDAAYSV